MSGFGSLYGPHIVIRRPPLTSNAESARASSEATEDKTWKKDIGTDKHSVHTIRIIIPD